MKKLGKEWVKPQTKVLFSTGKGLKKLSKGQIIPRAARFCASVPATFTKLSKFRKRNPPVTHAQNLAEQGIIRSMGAEEWSTKRAKPQKQDLDRTVTAVAVEK